MSMQETSDPSLDFVNFEPHALTEDYIGGKNYDKMHVNLPMKSRLRAPRHNPN